MLPEFVSRLAADFAAALIYEATDIRAGQNSLLPKDQPRAHVLLSNELIDALPIHIVEARAGRLILAGRFQ